MALGYPEDKLRKRDVGDKGLRDLGQEEHIEAISPNAVSAGLQRLNFTPGRSAQHYTLFTVGAQ